MIRVVLAEDMHLIRGALVALLDMEPDVEVVADVSSGEAVMPAVLEHRPDVAVLDVQMPGIDGLQAASMIAEQAPECRTLILTQNGRPDVLRRALSAKALGFMLKDAPPAELAGAIRRVAAGERVIDPDLATATIEARANPLTDREVEVLRLAGEGDEPGEIAARLHLAKGTVRNYLGTIVTKLGARNRLDAVRIATEAGWL
ncbi:response regulator transcription factor [Marinactinospora thermotolerans]|uniref:Two component transcriptional regulator, LuxR family n=1 Tax=Marinactinospora thermotolerans DSM 45154 TaxID=1122192 RepID=A0A1T4RED3_9ACTN|nr:response regulator transcription factor [Marinactinospora thermotolerans]SKA14372.1 two component transcriptional regulator, LuxR family [Marinactinospora thermotolerans DSM 45154]